MDYQTFEKAASVLYAINSKQRQRVLNRLIAKPGSTNTQLYSYLRMPQPKVSGYLTILRDAGLVICERDGSLFTRYYANKEAIQALRRFCKQIIKTSGI